MQTAYRDEQELRRCARAALNEGLIPRERPKSLWGGHGAGDICPVCSQAIDETEMELEVEFAEDGAHDFHLHLPCFAAWEIERKVTPE